MTHGTVDVHHDDRRSHVDRRDRTGHRDLLHKGQGCFRWWRGRTQRPPRPDTGGEHAKGRGEEADGPQAQTVGEQDGRSAPREGFFDRLVAFHDQSVGRGFVGEVVFG